LSELRRIVHATDPAGCCGLTVRANRVLAGLDQRQRHELGVIAAFAFATATTNDMTDCQRLGDLIAQYAQDQIDQETA
jgi:hypothetical protein